MTTSRSRSEKPGHYDYRTKVRVIHHGGVWGVDMTTGYGSGVDVADYSGPRARIRAYAHAKALRAALKVKP